MCARVIKAPACRHGGGGPGPGPGSTVASLVSFQQHRRGDGAAGGSVPARGPPVQGPAPARYQEIQDQTRNRRLIFRRALSGGLRANPRSNWPEWQGRRPQVNIVTIGQLKGIYAILSRER